MKFVLIFILMFMPLISASGKGPTNIGVVNVGMSKTGVILATHRLKKKSTKKAARL